MTWVAERNHIEYGLNVCDYLVQIIKTRLFLYDMEVFTISMTFSRMITKPKQKPKDSRENSVLLNLWPRAHEQYSS